MGGETNRNRNTKKQLLESKSIKTSIVLLVTLFVVFIVVSSLSVHSVIAQSMTAAEPPHDLSDSQNVSNRIAPALANNSNPSISLLQDGSPISVTKYMRNSNETQSPLAGEKAYVATSGNYVFSQNKTEVSTPNNNSHTAEFGKDKKIALVMPTFTATAYDDAFYVFYQKYIKTPHGMKITTDLDLLSNRVTNQLSSTSSGSAMLFLVRNLKWITSESTINSITDQDVDAGAIFDVGGENAYDVIILGHQEYVTQREYDNLKRFVGNGGTMIILDENVFYAEVKYDRNNDIISLVKGHSWAFNGVSAWPSVNERWKNETAQWVGSNYASGIAKFSDNPFDYFPHEEQYVTNPRDIILLNYGASTLHNSPGKLVVATYELNYLKGNIIAIGLYSDDIITNGSFDRYFDSLFYLYAYRIHD